MKHAFYLILFIYMFQLPGSGIAQNIDTLLKGGGSNQDFFWAVERGDSGSYYMLLRTLTGNTVEILDSTLNDPPGFSSDACEWYIKADSNLNIKWIKPTQTASYSAYCYESIAVLGANSYRSGIDIDSTYRYDANGNIEWQIPYFSGLCVFDNYDRLNLIGVQSVNDSINSVPIPTTGTTVAQFDTSGNYLHHFTASYPGFALTSLIGKNDEGYFGYRQVSITGSSATRVEVILCDSLGNLLKSELVNFNNPSISYAMDYDPINKYYYFHGCFSSRVPLNKMDSTSIVGKDYYIIQLDSNLNISRSLRMSGGGLGFSSYQSVMLDFKDGNIYLGATSLLGPQFFSHLGVANYLDIDEKEYVFAKLDEGLNVKWFHVLKDNYYTNRISKVSVQNDSTILFFGSVSDFTQGTLSFDAWGGSDAFITSIKDSDSTTNYLQGKVFIDLNQNGIDDDSTGMFGASVYSTATSIQNYTNSSGEFSAGASLGANTLICEFVPQYWIMSTPDSIDVTVLPSDSLYLTGFKFGMHPISGVNDVSIAIQSLSDLNPGFDAGYVLTFCNNANDTLSGEILLIQDSSLFFLSANISPDYIFSDTIIWNYDSLVPGECRHIFITDSVANDVSLFGDFLSSLVYITPLATDTIPENNYDSTSVFVTGSYDPNEITVSPGGCLDSSFSVGQDALVYTIKFQNTGTDTASFVKVVDELHPLLDPTTITIENFSHDFSYTVTGQKVIFSFNDINLPDSGANFTESNGFVEFSVKPSTAFATGNVINNSVAIFFDFNPPILTNTVYSQLIQIFDTVNVEACDQYLSPSGNLYFLSGIYADTLINTLGCDSILTTNLLVKNSYSSLESAVDCGQYFWTASGVSYAATGTYLIILAADNGCDSMVTLDLIVLPEYSTTETITACDAYFWPVNSQTYTSSGLFSETYNTSAGCDSVLTLNLSVNSVLSGVTQSSNELTADQDGGVYQWLTCPDMQPIAGATGQNYLAMSNGGYVVVVTLDGCSDTSNCMTVNGLGILQEESDFTWDVFPNPTTGDYTIVLNQSASHFFVEVSDLSGRILSQKAYSNSSSCLSTLNVENGVYLISILFEDGSVYTKYLVKN